MPDCPALPPSPRSRSKRLHPLAYPILAALVAPAPVLAQSTEGAEASAELRSLDRVIVTAGKREEDQRELAGTVTVLDGIHLERDGIVDQEGAFKLAPGVQLNKGDAGANNITIRGLTTQSATEGGGAQQQPTGLYLEDVPLNAPIGKGVIPDLAPFDLDRIEVLRGPQGALFGSGSLGGAVRYLFARPDLDKFGASAMVSVANASGGGTGVSGYGMLNAPIADGLAAVRLVAYDRNEPGFIDNLGTGTRDVNALEQRGGRVLFSGRPTDGFAATLVLSTERLEQDGRAYVTPDPDSSTRNAPTDGTAKTAFDFGSLTVDYDVGGHTFTSLTGYWRTDASGMGDDTELFASLGLVLPAVIRPFDNSSHAASQEFRVASNGDGPWSYVAGVFYQRSSSEGDAAQIAQGAEAIFGTDVLVDMHTRLGGTEAALFFDGEYRFDDAWSASVGGRYYRTTTRYHSEGYTFPAETVLSPPDGKETGVTPKISVKYRFGDGAAWYGLASKGYRYGGVNVHPPFSTYRSDSLWNYETGLRLNPLPGMQLDLTAFLLDWSDAQFVYYDDSGALPFSGIGNVGKARSVGVEGVFRYRFSQALDVAAMLAYLDAETTEDFLTAPGQLIPAGSRLPGSAKLQTSLQANFRFDGPFGSAGTFGALHSYLGSRYTDLGGQYVAPEFQTLDLSLGFVRDGWSVSGHLANAFDSRGVLSRTGSPGVPWFGQYYLQRPRTFTLSLRYDY